MTTKTMNQMILATLRTKTDKTPTNLAALEEAGYTVFDSGNSRQGFWAVKRDGHYLVVSKNMGEETSLYLDGFTNIECGFDRVKRIDFEGVLSTGVARREARKDYGVDPYPLSRCRYWTADYEYRREYHCENLNVKAYKKMKEATQVNYWKQRELDEAEAALDKAVQALVKAQAAYDKELDRCKQAERELAVFLADKGIR